MIGDTFKVLGGLVIMVVFVLGLSYIGLKSYAFFNPRYEQVRYDTFKNSQTYNDSMTRELYKIKQQYLSANDTDKAALKAYASHEFSVYQKDRLPADLQSFYDLVVNQ